MVPADRLPVRRQVRRPGRLLAPVGGGGNDMARVGPGRCTVTTESERTLRLFGAVGTLVIQAVLLAGIVQLATGWLW